MEEGEDYTMRTQPLKIMLLLAALCGSTLAARAQEVVHALTGTVTTVTPKSSTILVQTDDGTEGKFTTKVKAGLLVDLPKNIKPEVVPAATFTKVQTRVLVFYIGDDETRTTVGLKDLGAGPFVKDTGTVVKLDKHAHTLKIKNAKGVEESFQIDGNTIGEAAEGVEEGDKFNAHTGDSVRVIATSANGVETALFIREL
jgi:hypothetical protein